VASANGTSDHTPVTDAVHQLSGWDDAQTPAHTTQGKGGPHVKLLTYQTLQTLSKRDAFKDNRLEGSWSHMDQIKSSQVQRKQGANHTPKCRTTHFRTNPPGYGCCWWACPMMTKEAAYLISSSGSAEEHIRCSAAGPPSRSYPYAAIKITTH